MKTRFDAHSVDPHPQIQNSSFEITSYFDYVLGFGKSLFKINLKHTPVKLDPGKVWTVLISRLLNLFTKFN